MKPPVREEAWRLWLIIMALVLVIIYASSTYHVEMNGYEEAIGQEQLEKKLYSNMATELQLRLEDTTETVDKLFSDVEYLKQTVNAKDMELAEKDEKIQELEEELRKKETVTPASAQGTALGNFEVTWYNDYGHTKSGRFVEKGVTVAVDPRVIPLDSWLKLEFPDGTEMIRRADDTGGAVKGNIVDIYDNASDKALRQRGRTHGVKVTLLPNKF